MASQPTDHGSAGDVGSGRVTSADVARLAGVSRATVSQILNEQVDRFSADTVRRVRASATTLGYVRSAAGRALVNGHSDFIVVVVPYTTFPKLQDIVEALSVDLEGIGFSVVVHFSLPLADGGPRRLHHLVRTLRPAGLVHLGGLSATDVSLVERAGCPVVPRARLDSNLAIGRLQAAHLSSRGYTELAYAFLSDVREDPFGQERGQAVADYCAAEGLAPLTFLHVPIKAEGAQDELSRLLALSSRPVAIACHNDVVALALLFAAHRLGLSVPGDVALMGAEGLDVGQVVSPRLTTTVTNVPAILRQIRYQLAQTYPRLAPAGDLQTADQAFAVLPGQTT